MVYFGVIRRGLDVLCDMDVDEGGWLVSNFDCFFILICIVLVKKICNLILLFYRFDIEFF